MLNKGVDEMTLVTKGNVLGRALQHFPPGAILDARPAGQN